MILISKINDASMAMELQEIETDRAKGIGVKIHIKKKNLNAKFFNLWIEKDSLSKFVRNLKKVIAGQASIAALNSQTRDDLYLVLVGKDELLFIGVQVSTYHFTPISFKNQVALSFEIEREYISLFIKELEYILAKF
jgi:hypothetical protein